MRMCAWGDEDHAAMEVVLDMVPNSPLKASDRDRFISWKEMFAQVYTQSRS